MKFARSWFHREEKASKKVKRHPRQQTRTDCFVCFVYISTFFGISRPPHPSRLGGHKTNPKDEKYIYIYIYIYNTYIF